MTVTFKMEGFEELIKQMDELGQEVGKAKTDAIWRKAMGYAMQPVLEDAKSFAPKETGEMASRIYMKVHRPMARDKQGQRYAGEAYMARVTASPIRSDSVLNYTVNSKGKQTDRGKEQREREFSAPMGSKVTCSSEDMDNDFLRLFR